MSLWLNCEGRQQHVNQIRGFNSPRKKPKRPELMMWKKLECNIIRICGCRHMGVKKKYEGVIIQRLPGFDLGKK